MNTPVYRVFTACMAYEKCARKENVLYTQRSVSVTISVASFVCFLPIFLLTDSGSYAHWVAFVSQIVLLTYLGFRAGRISRKLGTASAETTRAWIARKAIVDSALKEEATQILVSSGPQAMVN